MTVLDRFRVDDRVAIVTGASSGLGVGFALALAEAGADTVALPQAAYASSKAGLIGLTRDLAQQWTGRKGIRVNALAPGYFESEMTDQFGGDYIETSVIPRTLMGRLGHAEELNTAMIFLASDASSYITGTTLAVDGGMLTN